MTPVPVLYVHNSAQIAGGNRALLGLIDHLDRRRFRPVCVLPEGGAMEEELRTRGVRYRVVPYVTALTGGTFKSLNVVLALARVLLAERIRIVHANDGRCYRHVSIAARWLGRRRICHLQFPPERPGLEWALRVRPAALITCSAHMSRELREAGLPCLESVPIVPVENAVDTERFRPPAEVGPLRRSLGLPEDSKVVTIVGSVSERKGHRDFLDAACGVLQRCPSALFLVVGDDLEGKGAYRHAMEEHAERLGIASRVRFVGFRPDTEVWVAASDVVVLPSTKEGLPLSLAEAHGCGKPVVSTRVDGIPEVVEEGVTGFLFDPHDVKGIVAAVIRLLEDEALRDAMGTAARERAERVFSQRAHAAKVVGLYERLLAS